MNKGLWIACCASPVLLSACISHKVTGYVPDPGYAGGTPNGYEGYFDYPPGDLPMSDSQSAAGDASGDSRYRVRLLRYPSHGENGQPDNLVTATYYQSRLPGRHTLAIVLPIWGTYTYPSDKLSRGLRRRSAGTVNVLKIHGERHLIDWPELATVSDEEEFERSAAQMVQRVRNTVIDIRRLIDWATEQTEIDPERISLVGFSMGAVVGAMLVPNEPRIAATVLVMGAAHPGEIIASCDGKPQQLRDTVLPRFGWSLERYRALFTDLFDPGNPVHYAGRVRPERILLIDAHHDQCMPRETRDALWVALGRPQRMTFQYGHKTSFLSMTPLGFNFMDRRIHRFLADTLG